MKIRHDWCFVITQYSSTVYCHGWSSSIITIHTEINLNLSSKDTSGWRTCEKVTACTILDEIS